MFYDFDKVFTKELVWSEILKRSKVTDDGCRIWTGKLDNRNCPRFSIRRNKKTIFFYPTRLAYQLSHPEEKLQGSIHSVQVMSTCLDPMCFADSHLQISLMKQEWDLQKVKRSLEASTERQVPTAGFETGCLLWSKAKDNDGYGKGTFCSKTLQCHIAAMLVFLNVDAIPLTSDDKQQVVRHKCRNRNCCEPSHLELGSSQDNFDDMKRDGTVRKGINHGGCKISEEIARTIKLSWRPKDHFEWLSQTDRGKPYGVSQILVSKIDNGEAWAHLPGVEERTYKGYQKIKGIDRDSLTTIDYETILKKIHKSTIDGKIIFNGSACREWQGRYKRDYGLMQYKNTEFRTHVVACEAVAKQRTPKGMIVRHLCNNKKCCNPSHLKFGTTSENSCDAFLNNHSSAKLSVADVVAIRASQNTLRILANHYGVQTRTIKSVISKSTWDFV